MPVNRTTSIEDINPIIIDAGVVYKNYGETGEKQLGITRGGTTFNVEPEYKDLERDGARGKEKGLRRIINLDVTLTTNIMSLTKETMKDVLGASSVEGSIVKSKLDIDDTDYIDNVTVVGETMEGNYVRITVKNALSDQGIDITLEDKEETAVEVAFSGHFDPNAATADDYSDIYEIEYLDTYPETE